MTQFEFDKLIEKYLAGDCTEAETRLIDEWTAQQIAHATPSPLSISEENDIGKRLKKRLDATTGKVWRLPFRFSVYRLGVAACLAGLMVFGFWFFQKKGQNTEGSLLSEKTASFELSNTTNTEQEFKLKDGSTIRLKPNSQLTYFETFGAENRSVFLKGAGSFQVKRDTAKPFFVYAGNLVTRVLGTSFSIKTSENGEKAEVIVTSGKVMVYETQNGKAIKSVVLTPNQKVNYTPTTELKAQIVENPIVVAPLSKTADFVFENAELSTVLSRLQQVYEIPILTKNQLLLKCAFTGDLNGLSLNEQLDLICKTIDARHERYETAIWLSGEGCL